MYGGFDDDENAFDQLGSYGVAAHMAAFLNRGFKEMYKCYPTVMMPGNERESVKFGGKIILPQSALVKLASLNIEYPMLFKLDNKENGNHTHAGVLEFIAEEGRVYLPQWMMQTLLLEPGNIIEVSNASLQLGKFVKIEPQSVDFLDITDPKAVLERALRNFSTLTRGDIIQINYNDKSYEIRVLEIRPETQHGGVSIVETDLEVDFAPPIGYVEPTRVKPQSRIEGPRMAPELAIDQPVQQQKTVFTGPGIRLNGKASATGKEPAQLTTEPSAATQDEEGIPAALNLPFGQLFFGYPVVPIKSKEKGAGTAENGTSKTAFEGQGQLLRAPRNATAGSSRTASPAPGSPARSPRAQPVAGGDVEPFKGKGKVTR